MSLILTLNGGSSSIKFALFKAASMQRTLHGQVERIGLSNTRLIYHAHENDPAQSAHVTASDFRSAAEWLLDWLAGMTDFNAITAIGHRVVHGMQHVQHARITDALLADLQRISTVDPEHLPGEIRLMQMIRQRHPKMPQVACFDTAFHSQMPRVAKLLPIPRKYAAQGIQRYGFHGLSYAYLLQELKYHNINNALQNNIIIAHLGNGSSLAAVRNGRCVDTSMGYTPAGGVMMGTRSGDLDPGVAWQLLQIEHLSPQQFSSMLNHESGLKGVSETSADMRELLAQEQEDVRAAEAVELYCYQIRKCIGAYAAVLGGLEVLVFSGGIGENAHQVRERICANLEFLGIRLDTTLNCNNAAVISAADSRVTVRVMHTDEELMIARSVYQMQATGF